MGRSPRFWRMAEEREALASTQRPPVVGGKGPGIRQKPGSHHVEHIGLWRCGCDAGRPPGEACPAAGQRSSGERVAPAAGPAGLLSSGGTPATTVAGSRRRSRRSGRASLSVGAARATKMAGRSSGARRVGAGAALEQAGHCSSNCHSQRSASRHLRRSRNGQALRKAAWPALASTARPSATRAGPACASSQAKEERVYSPVRRPRVHPGRSRRSVLRRGSFWAAKPAAAADRSWVLRASGSNVPAIGSCQRQLPGVRCRHPALWPNRGSSATIQASRQRRPALVGAGSPGRWAWWAKHLPVMVWPCEQPASPRSGRPVGPPAPWGLPARQVSDAQLAPRAAPVQVHGAALLVRPGVSTSTERAGTWREWLANGNAATGRQSAAAARAAARCIDRQAAASRSGLKTDDHRAAAQQRRARAELAACYCRHGGASRPRHP